MSCFCRRDKFARERPGPRDLRRPPSPPSPYWRPPPSRPPPRAFPYPPPSVPREVSLKTSDAVDHDISDGLNLLLPIHGKGLFSKDTTIKNIAKLIHLSTFCISNYHYAQEPRGPPSHYGSGSPLPGGGGPPSKRARTQEGTRSTQVYFLIITVQNIYELKEVKY